MKWSDWMDLHLHVHAAQTMNQYPKSMDACFYVIYATIKKNLFEIYDCSSLKIITEFWGKNFWLFTKISR